MNKLLQNLKKMLNSKNLKIQKNKEDHLPRTQAVVVVVIVV